MLRRSRHFVGLALFVMLVLALSGCRREKVYLDYVHAPSDGWKRADTIHFNVSPLKEAGDYCLRLGLRSDNDYPFMNIAVIVEQQLLPDGHLFIDTIKCDLTRSNGRSRGMGVNLYQYVVDIDTIYLDMDDSLAISIRHDIKCDTLKGISDIGIELVK